MKISKLKVDMRYLIILMALVVASCQSPGEHGHAHDAQGGHINESEDTPTVEATIWTDKTELFVEFPALVVGKTSRFAAHFTILDKHKPVREGTVKVSLIKEGKGIRHTVETPSSPGIFTPSLQPKGAGIYQLVFDINTPTLSDKIVMNDVEVFATIDDAVRDLGKDIENGGAITFLKEQAWKIEFQTTRVVQGEIYSVIPTSGVWKASPSDYKTLVAPTSGTIAFKSGNLTKGSKVKKAQVLMTVSSAGFTSNNLSTEIRKAKAEFEQAKSAYERKKQLYESKIVPKSEFEQVERNYQIARSTYETLSSGYSSGGKQVIVPFDGYVKAISVGNGDFVDQGTNLISITSHQSSLLEIQVSSSYASQLSSIHDVWYQPKAGYWSSLSKTGGSILSVGKDVERDQPLLSVFAQVNDVVEMPEGGFTEVQVAFGKPIKAPVIPELALLEDYGNYTVIVQLSGESYERRPVTIGKRNGSEVEIKEGLRIGEVVVIKGAYQVKMASMSGQAPVHGHAH